MLDRFKICILTTVHSVFDTRIFRKQAKSLHKSGYNVVLIVQHDKKEIIEGIKIIPLEKPNNRFERIIKTTFQLYKKALKTEADIYHFHDPELIPVGLLLKLKGKKVIYDVHEDVPKQILSKKWIWRPVKKMVSLLVNGIEKIADKYLDGIISATPTIDKKFINKNSIMVQNFPLLGELLTTKNKNNNLIDKNIITYVGGITSARGIKEMIKAVELIPEKYQTEFLLAGKFSSQQLKREVQGSNGWKRVFFKGWIDRSKMAEILSKSKAGLVLFHSAPNHIDAQPNKMFEYMSAGLPVIASNFPLWKEIIEGNNCGLTVDPERPEEISETIQYIFDHTEEAKQMGKNGRKVVAEKYNWSVEEEKLLKLYKVILED